MLLTLLVAVALIVLGAAQFYYSIQPKIEETDIGVKWTATRLLDTAIIDVDLHPSLEEEAERVGYPNINGPSLFRVPDWIEAPLGRYYLYFAHHKGKHIRMAFADELSGPWTYFEDSTGARTISVLPLEQTGTPLKEGAKTTLTTLLDYMGWSEAIALLQIGRKTSKVYKEKLNQDVKTSEPTTPHLASPEIVVDHEQKRIILYFHAVVEGSLQMSFVAQSKDGLQFDVTPEPIALPYLRSFSGDFGKKLHGQHYYLTMPGMLYRSEDGLTNFEVRQRWLLETDVRHAGLYLKGTNLHLFYTRVGDEPERILYTKVDVSSPNWKDWRAGPTRELLRPEKDWEGAKLPIQPSLRGEVSLQVNQVRDPDIYEDQDGKLYLLYAGGGEQGIGIASLKMVNDK